MTTKIDLMNFAGLHSRIAANAFPDGARLECLKCQRERIVDTEDCARFIRTGWPKCCGCTMTATKAKQRG
jgi:hypothetical protein